MFNLLRYATMKFILPSILCLFFSQCANPPEYPIEPQLSFIGLSKSNMKQGAINADSLLVTVGFTDGDGDIGTDDSLSLFVTDTRDNFLAAKYKLPFVAEQGAANGISGEISFVLESTCCYYPDIIPPCTPSTVYPKDTVIYTVMIKDRAGNKSNQLALPMIFLDCTK